MTTETVTWVPVGESLPDVDTTVNIATVNASEPVWLGYYDAAAGGWFDTEGNAVEVSHWAEMLKGPAR